MKMFIKSVLLVALVSAFGAGISACAMQGPTDDEGTEETELVAEAEQPLVTCSTDCSATGGPSITKSCTTCSATNSSITCDGVTTQCQSLPACGTKCKYGVCASCDAWGEPTTCYVYNGCGGKYMIP